jgi:protein-disulfide isomerase
MNKNERNLVKKQFNKEVKILLFSISALAAVVLGIYYFTPKKEVPPPLVVTQNMTTPLFREFNHKSGPDDAKVKIIEFYDPECEACAAFFPFVRQMKSRLKDKVQLIARYALYHGNSKLAAQASDAAGLQGKFWEYQELLFLNQKKWSHSQTPATVRFLEYAQDLNLDLNKFKEDMMNNAERMKTISLDLEDGVKLGVNGTPTFFVNGRMLGQLHPDKLNEMIENELK